MGIPLQGTANLLYPQPLAGDSTALSAVIPA